MGDPAPYHAPGTERSTMPRRHAFTILDGIVLVAVMAVGLTLARNFWAFGDAASYMRDMREPQKSANLFASVSSRFVCPAMLGLLIIRLRRPRPPLRRLVAQPGLAACLAGTVAMVAGGAVVLSLTLFRTVGISSRDQTYWPIFIDRIWPAVIAAWVALILVGRWRPERSWIDRAGRALGAYWIVLGLYELGYAWGVPGCTPLIGI